MNQDKIFTVGELTLVKGVGNYEDASACVMSAARAIYRIEQGLPIGEISDELECACPVIRQLCIGRNDGHWKSDEERSQWGRRLIPRIIGSRDDSKTLERTFRCVDVVVREMALDVAGRSDDAKKLRTLPQVVDRETAFVATKAADIDADASFSSSSFAVLYAADAAYAASTGDVDDAVFYVASATYEANDVNAAAWGMIESLIEEFLEIDKKPLTQVEIRKLQFHLPTA